MRLFWYYTKVHVLVGFSGTGNNCWMRKILSRCKESIENFAPKGDFHILSKPNLGVFKIHQKLLAHIFTLTTMIRIRLTFLPTATLVTI